MTYFNNGEVPDTLKHYGVLGMKWGVRKDRKRQAENATATYRQGIQSRFVKKSNPISESDYRKLSSKDVHISKAGETLRRVDGSDKGSIGDKTYVSKTSEDHNRYVALLDPGGNPRSKKFELTIKTSKDLVSPSKKARIDTFIETLNEPIKSSDGRSIGLGRAFIEDKASKALSDKQLGLMYYNRFAQSQVMNTPLHQAYFEKIKNKGYTALVDDADAGIVSDLPIILFSNEAGARVSGVRRILDDEILDAQINLQRLNS